MIFHVLHDTMKLVVESKGRHPPACEKNLDDGDHALTRKIKVLRDYFWRYRNVHRKLKLWENEIFQVHSIKLLSTACLKLVAIATQG
jgi:hypothetical protein